MEPPDLLPPTALECSLEVVVGFTGGKWNPGIKLLPVLRRLGDKVPPTWAVTEPGFQHALECLGYVHGAIGGAVGLTSFLFPDANDPSMQINILSLCPHDLTSASPVDREVEHRDDEGMTSVLFHELQQFSDLVAVEKQTVPQVVLFEFRGSVRGRLFDLSPCHEWGALVPFGIPNPTGD